MDELILRWFERHQSPALDGVFLVSNVLGLGLLCVPLVSFMIAWHLTRGGKREAWTWLVVGLATWLLTDVLKAVIGRPRPALWPRLIEVSSLSFPSGHALAGMSLYPLGLPMMRERMLSSLMNRTTLQPAARFSEKRSTWEMSRTSSPPS